jgi:hypothetical protein
MIITELAKIFGQLFFRGEKLRINSDPKNGFGQQFGRIFRLLGDYSLFDQFYDNDRISQNFRTTFFRGEKLRINSDPKTGLGNTLGEFFAC